MSPAALTALPEFVARPNRMECIEWRSEPSPIFVIKFFLQKFTACWKTCFSSSGMNARSYRTTITFCSLSELACDVYVTYSCNTVTNTFYFLTLDLKFVFFLKTKSVISATGACVELMNEFRPIISECWRMFPYSCTKGMPDGWSGSISNPRCKFTFIHCIAFLRWTKVNGFFILRSDGLIPNNI